MAVISSGSGRSIEQLLSADILEQTEAALQPLADAARHLKRRGQLLVAVPLAISLSFVIAALLGETAASHAILGAPFGLFALAAASFARAIWKGTVRPPGFQVVEPDLPMSAAALLQEIRTGRRLVRFAPDARPESSYRLLQRADATGPFSPLLLSARPEVSVLAFWSLLGGDRLNLLIEVHPEDRCDARASSTSRDVDDEGNATMAGAAELASINEPSLGPPIAERTNDADATTAGTLLGRTPMVPNAEAVCPAPPPVSRSGVHAKLDQRLFAETAELQNLLDTAFPPQTRERRQELIVDAVMLAQELLAVGPKPKTVKDLVGWVVVGLKAPNCQPVHLVKQDAAAARTPHEFRYAKVRNAGYRTVGLRPDSDSSSWIEQVLTGRYDDVNEALADAEGRLRAT